MLNSNERIDYINSYLSAYENKIKMANKQGLFDAAKMFELFALNICALWFGQPFKNLNTEVANYPYVDLISEDQRLFVQVSTLQDIAGKIKSTLEKVRDSKDSRFSSVENIVFFVLHNQSTDHISDFIGDAQIGNTPFTKKDRLISTQDILAKAQTDFKFQSELYDLLRADEFSTSNNEASFRSALAYSKNVGLKNIDYLIHNEYQIDRSPLVSQVKADDFRFISIQGLAGSGKSAFCKILLESEELVLYARAERFIEESDLNSIWSFDIEKILTYINGKKLTFFIDALEFISDCRQTKFELLQQLYTIAQGYENVYVVTSCRSSEKGAFIKLETNLGIHSYLVDNLSDEELLPIAAKYPVIKKMCEMKAYSSLLRIPFYIELILEKDINPDDIHDEVALREYIWYYIICQKERARNYQLKFNEIAQTVKKIVFDRANRYLERIMAYSVDMTHTARSQKLPPEKLIKFLIAAEGGPLAKELHRAGIDATPAAVSQRRRQIRPLYSARCFWTSHPPVHTASPIAATRAAAFNMARNPNAPSFVCNNSAPRGYNQLHLSPLFDIYDRTYFDAVIQPAPRKDEPGALVEMVKRNHFNRRTIIVLDRGYESYNVMAHLMNTPNVYFVLRVKHNHSAMWEIARLPMLELDCDIAFTISTTQTNEDKRNRHIYLPQPKKSKPGSTTRRARWDFPSPYTMRLRIVRFQLDNGNFETLATSLPRSFTVDDLKEIYHQRWGIETSFRSLKYSTGLVNPHGKGDSFVEQEIFAALTAFNFTSRIVKEVVVRQPKDGLYAYAWDISFPA